MKTTTGLCLVLAFVGLAGCKHHAHRPAAPLTPVAEVSAAGPTLLIEDSSLTQQFAKNQPVESLLQRHVTLSKDNMPLEQVIAFMHDVTGANIAVNWPALELVGIDQDSLVSLQLSNVPISQLLDLTLEQVSADAFDDDKAGYAIHDGIVKISTRRDLKSDTIVGIYEVGWYLAPRDLMQRWLYRDEPRAAAIAEHLMWRHDLLELVKPPPFDLNDALSGTSSGGSGSKNRLSGIQGSLFPEVPLEQPDAINERIEELIELIMSTVGDEDEWLDEESTVTAIRTHFIIKTTHENHPQIQQLLTKLYNTQREQFREQAKLIEVFLLLNDAEKYRLKQRYKEALVLVNKALRVDPASPEALALRDVLNQTMARYGHLLRIIIKP